ncbi:nucleoside 2-deoxyribosyltransferase [Streptomyces sp. NPDC002514]|uniref:nucleoside 2-deoxyribosyltransferase n=1 Tax=unclassified Streptomyces TaxID=2593676 RepID=UPI003694DD8A
MNRQTGLVDTMWQHRLESLRRAFIDSGATVFNAHHSEAWGAEWRAASVCTPIDFTAMAHSDVVCAIVGSPQSGGVAVELGWASALHKPILLVLPSASGHSQLIDGLGSITSVASVQEPTVWSRSDIDDLVRRTTGLATAVGHFQGSAHTPPGSRRQDHAPTGELEFCSAEECRHEASPAAATGA